MRFYSFSLKMLMSSTVIGSMFLGAAARAADVATALTGGALSQQAATVTVGPVYAFGPVLQVTKPRAPKQSGGRQRNWSDRDGGRNYGLLPSAPYRNDQTQAITRPWQPYSPRAYWNSANMNNPYQYGYHRPWRAQPRNSLAWFHSPYQRNEDQARYRQPYWRY